jgi:hypothetical protein
MGTEHVGIKDKIHVVRQDIGGMTAQAYGAQFPEHVASINWGEWPPPGENILVGHKAYGTALAFRFPGQDRYLCGSGNCKEEVIP